MRSTRDSRTGRCRRRKHRCSFEAFGLFESRVRSNVRGEFVCAHLVDKIEENQNNQTPLQIKARHS